MRVMVVPKAQIIHHQGKTAKRYPIRAKVEYYSSLITFMKKNRGGVYTGIFICGLAVSSFVNFVLQAFLSCATLFLVRSTRGRCARYAGLLFWLVSGRPASHGLSGIKR
jgi:GT2 family glycosyltransferase